MAKSLLTLALCVFTFIALNTIEAQQGIEALPPLPPHEVTYPQSPKPQPPLPHHHEHEHEHHHHHQHHHHAPEKSPTKKPYPPYHQPEPKTFIAVEGLVYCESCKYPGVDTLLDAYTVSGATVELNCNGIKTTATTDKYGYFWAQQPNTITNYEAYECKAYLVSSPNPTCNKPSGLNGGASGATLKFVKRLEIANLPFTLYSVGPLAFAPKCH